MFNLVVVCSAIPFGLPGGLFVGLCLIVLALAVYMVAIAFS